MYGPNHKKPRLVGSKPVKAYRSATEVWNIWDKRVNLLYFPGSAKSEVGLRGRAGRSST